jgi:hypothetical protein
VGQCACWFAQHFEEDSSGDSISHQVGPNIVDPLLLNSATGVFNFRLRSTDGSGEDDNPMKLMEAWPCPQQEVPPGLRLADLRNPRIASASCVCHRPGASTCHRASASADRAGRAITEPIIEPPAVTAAPAKVVRDSSPRAFGAALHYRRRPVVLAQKACRHAAGGGDNRSCSGRRRTQAPAAPAPCSSEALTSETGAELCTGLHQACA